MSTPITKLFAALTALALSGCGGAARHKNSDQPSPSDSPSFSEVNTVLASKCAPCHTDGSRHSALVGHQDTFEAEAANIRVRITTKDPAEQMPLQLGTSPLTPAEKKSFNAALSSPNAAAATYTELAPIIEKSCSRCHGDDSPFLKFAGHEDAVKANAAKILVEVNAPDPNDAMPPLTKVLTSAELDVLVRYIDAL